MVSSSSDSAGAGGATSPDASGDEAGSQSGDAGDSGGATADKGLVESLPSGGAPQLQRGLVTGEVPSLSSATFARDVRRLLAEGSANGRAVPPPATSDNASPDAYPETSARPSEAASQDAACPGPDLEQGATSTPVVVDGSLAALVVHPVRDGRRLVEAWSCAGSTRVATTTLAP